MQRVHKYKQILAVLSLLLVLMGGCGSLSENSRSVILQNPETLEFVNCNVDKWGTFASYARNEKCVEDYENQGYVVWGEH